MFFQLRADRINEANELLSSQQITADVFLKRVAYKDYYLTDDCLNLEGETFSQETCSQNGENSAEICAAEISAEPSPQSDQLNEEPDEEKGGCPLCSKKIELTLIPCFHCLCKECWDTMVNLHKKKLGIYEFNESDENDVDFTPPNLPDQLPAPARRYQLRTNRRRIAQEIQKQEEVEYYPPCQIRLSIFQTKTIR